MLHIAATAEGNNHIQSTEEDSSKDVIASSSLENALDSVSFLFGHNGCCLPMFVLCLEHVLMIG
jgi:hypothetical protein